MTRRRPRAERPAFEFFVLPPGPDFAIGAAVWCPYGYGQARGVVVDTIGRTAIVEVMPGAVCREHVRRRMDELLPRGEHR